MAMRPRGGGVDPIRPRAVVNRVYEQFRPISKWKKEEESDLLLVYLPGFKKENVNVTTESQNIVRVRGERLVAGNKWSRFQEDFQIPENCNFRVIRAKFEGEILTITMPWKTKDEAKTTQPTPSSQEANPKPISQTSREGIPSQAASTSDEKKPNDTSFQSPSTPKSTTTPNVTSTISANKPTDSKSLEASRPQTDDKAPRKGEVETPLSATSSSEDVVHQQAVERKEKNETKQRFNEAEPYPNAMEKTLVEEEKKGIEKGTEPTQASDKVINKIVEKITEKRDECEAKTASGEYNVENYKQVVKGLARALNEERQLMVNMGVAVLVIVALGAYVSYTFGKVKH